MIQAFGESVLLKTTAGPKKTLNDLKKRSNDPYKTPKDPLKVSIDPKIVLIKGRVWVGLQEVEVPVERVSESGWSGLKDEQDKDLSLQS
jgi:hypothetical protein